LDVKDGRVVKGVQFVDLRDQGDPVALGRRYMAEGADELVYLDITASYERRRTTVELARAVAQELFIPFTVGGGIASVEAAAEVLAEGADKVAINTAALDRPDLIREIADRFGSQAVVVAVDARKRDGSAGWDVYAEGGRRRTGREAVEWVVEAVDRGAGELLITSMDRDGTTAGYDTNLLSAIASAVPIPIIASGGAGRPEHLIEAARAGADGLLVASIVHEGVYSIGQLKQALADAGLPVRL
jgi:cyclase